MSADDKLENDPNAKSSKAMFNMESNPSIDKSEIDDKKKFNLF